LCIQCNQHKDNPGWKHEAGSGHRAISATTDQKSGAVTGVITITTPTGDIYTTTPQPLPHELPPETGSDNDRPDNTVRRGIAGIA
jgi:hypothetical protein